MVQLAHLFSVRLLVLFYIVVLIWGLLSISISYGQDRGWATAIAWSPDGETIAVGSSTGIWFFDNDFRELSHFKISEINEPPSTLDWNASGEYVAIAYTSLKSRVWTLLIIDVNRLRLVTRIDEATTSTIRWHPEKDFILGGTYAGGTYVWDALTGEELFYFEENDEDYPFYPNSTVAVCWLADNMIGIVTYGEIYLIDIEVNQILKSIPSPK